MESVAIRVQGMTLSDQALVLARLAEGRVESGRFAPADLDGLFDALGLPRPAKVSNVLLVLEREGLVARLKTGRGTWRLTPRGRAKSLDLVDPEQLAGLVSEATAEHAPLLGHASHPLIPPSLAPPELLAPVKSFLNEYPFETNVFGMTRFPDEQDDADEDPVAPVLASAREACEKHGLAFHLASDRAIVDDLWGNVAAHMWASRYGIAFFEDRRGRGINYNLTIEVGSMLVTGRRMALLKDSTIDRLPTDLVGKIYKAVDLEDLAATSEAIHIWIRDDLGLGPCHDCPRRAA